MKIAWITDPHLNFVTEERIKQLAEEVRHQNADCVVITGDIAEATSLRRCLTVLNSEIQALFKQHVPVYFVCGNHDYYRGSITTMRRTVLKNHFGQALHPTWLPNAGIITLQDNIALLGHDGWYDGGWPQYGNFLTSKLGMSDYIVISELRACRNRKELYNVICSLAQECADYIHKYVPKAFENHDKVIFATHVSPFPENALAPTGRISDRHWMPSFCSRISGQAFLDVMKKMPAEKELFILCGHNHTYAFHKPVPNITCTTGPAKYGNPDIAEIIDLDLL